MATGAVTAHIVVNFEPKDGAGGGILIAEIDDRPDGLNQGNTQFAPGDEVGFLIFKSDDVIVQSIDVTAASVSNVGSQDKDVEDIVVFPNEKDASVRYPISSNFTYKWLGRNLGTITQKENVLSLNKAGVGVAKVEYTATGTGHKLVNVPKQLDGEDKFAILIFVTGTSGNE